MSHFLTLVELSARALLREISLQAEQIDCPSHHDESVVSTVDICLEKYLERSSLLQKLSTLSKEMGKVILQEHFGGGAVTTNPNMFLLVLNVLNKGVGAKSLDFDRLPMFLMPKLSWIFLIRTIPSTITQIKLNNLMVDADAILAALAASSHSSKLRKLKIRQSLLTYDGLQHLQAMPRLRVLDMALCALPGALQHIVAHCKNLRVLYYGWIQGFSSRTLAASSQNLLDITYLNELEADGSLKLRKLEKLVLFGFYCSDMLHPAVNFIKTRHNRLRRLAQADHNQAYTGGTIPAALLPDNRGLPDKEEIAWNSDMISPPVSLAHNSHPAKKIVLYQEKWSVKHMGVALSKAENFPNLTKLILSSLGVTSLGSEVNLGGATSLTHLIIDNGLPSITAIPPSLTHVCLDTIRTGSLPNFMDLVYQMLLETQKPLEYLAISTCDAGPAVAPRGYVGHLIKYLKLYEIFQSGWLDMITPATVPETWVEALIPPHSQCRAPKLISCCLSLVPLFPTIHLGSLTDSTPYHLPRPLPAHRTVDKLSWPALLMNADVSNPIFSLLRMLEVHLAVGDDTNPLPRWLQEMDSFLPSLLSFTVYLRDVKIPPNFFSHRSLTTLAIHRSTTRSAFLDGATLPALRIMKLSGTYSAELTVANFPSLLHLTVGKIDASFSCSGVPQLISLAVTSGDSSLKIDAPNLRILSFEKNCQKVKFVTAPTLLEQLTFWITSRSSELAIRLIKDLKKLSCLNNLVGMVMMFTSEFHSLPQHEQRELSEEAIEKLIKSICGSSGVPLTQFFGTLPKLRYLRVGRQLCTPMVYDQAAQKMETDPPGAVAFRYKES